MVVRKADRGSTCGKGREEESEEETEEEVEGRRAAAMVLGLIDGQDYWPGRQAIVVQGGLAVCFPRVRRGCRFETQSPAAVARDGALRAGLRR